MNTKISVSVVSCVRICLHSGNFLCAHQCECYFTIYLHWIRYSYGFEEMSVIVLNPPQDPHCSGVYLNAYQLVKMPFGKRVSAYHIPVSMVSAGNNPHYYQV